MVAGRQRVRGGHDDDRDHGHTGGREPAGRASGVPGGRGGQAVAGGHAGMLDDVPVPMRVGLGGLLAIMLAVTGVGAWLSYESLHRWASGHGLHGQEAWVWPAVVDSFIAIGELGSAAWLWMRRDRTTLRERVSWYFAALTMLGFAGSLGANIAEAGPDLGSQFTASLPPAAALLAFAGVVRFGHELLDRSQGHADPVPAAVPVVPVPDPQAVPAAPAPRPVPAALPVPARRVAAARAPRPAVVVPVPEGGDVHARARRMWAESLVAGTPVTVAEMIAEMGKSERWHKTQRAAVGRTVEDARAYLDRVGP